MFYSSCSTVIAERVITCLSLKTKFGNRVAASIEGTKFLNLTLTMPQLIPFFFLNQLSYSFLTLLFLIFVFSKYVLPLFTLQQVTRMYITKLGNKS